MKTFDEFFMEEKLDAEDREKIKEDDWGIIIKDKDGNIIEKAYPMPDAQHVISAARMYPFAKRKYDAKVVAELRRKIIAKAKEYNVPDSRIQSVIDDTPSGKSKSVKEFVGPEDDTSGTSEFDESIDNDPDDCYTEAYDAVTGKEIPIDHAYTIDEMREITLSFTEDVKPGKLMKVSPPDSKYVYFGSPENHMPEIKLDRPLFVTPYKSIASIFIWRDMELQNRIPKGSYNCQYEEWLKFNKKESGRCLKDVHVYVEGYPDLEPYEIKQTGYVHQILTHNWNDNYYRYPWMDASKEWLIVNDNGNVEFDDVTECEITYHISGKPGFDKLGPRQDALEPFVRKSIKLIHDKYKKDQKDPIGNQNCLLCTWCFEARMRGLDVLPRPVYSPRDDVLDIPGNQIVFGSRQIKFKNYTDLASEISGAGDGCRFYVHVNWKDSKGGHEFIIMRISGKNFIIDPQQGKIEPLTKSHNYVSDINYDNSYIVQLSGKKFNRNLFDKWNDESTVLPWDPKKDIPYMLKEGMITKEEADKEFRKSSTERFTSELKRELKNHPIQESWNTEESLKLFKKLPKDLQDFLKNGDISDLDEDYGIDGYIVEEFSAPEYLEIAGKSYNLKDDDPMYNAIDFATDGGGNDFVYNPDDGYYYNLDHEDYDIYNHIHGDRLSSTKWSELIDPNRKSNKSSNPNVERTLEFRNMTESHLYWDICHVVLDDEIDTKLCNKIIDDYDVARKGTWHDEFFKKVDEFANKYDCSYIKAPVDEFKSFMKRDFRPTMFNWKFNSDGLKPRCMNIIKAFMKVIKELDIDTTQLNPPAYKLHKQIIAKYGTKMFQEGVIQNIKNKTSPFEKNLVYHISPEGHLDGQIFKPRVPDYLDKYDPSKTEFEDVETPRVCFSPSIEGCLNAIIVNIGRWKTANKLRDWYVYIPEKPLKEYKYRTNKQLVDEKKVYDANITKEIWIEEPVRLKQYGIIRIDSVTDKSRKKAVPTTLGEAKKRNVYDFKWHWLVKPKVLKDVPYDYSPLEVCKDMVADMESYKYGIPENGKIVDGSEHDYDTKWKLQSPEEFEKNGGGICYDFVEFEEGYLDAYGIKCKKYFMSTNLPGNDTHTFIIVDDGKGGLVYPESSFEVMAGTHQAKSKEEIFKMVANGFWKMNDNVNKVNEIKYYVWEYNGHPKYGSNIKQCIEYYSKGEPIFEAYTLKPGKSQPIQESMFNGKYNKFDINFLRQPQVAEQIKRFKMNDRIWKYNVKEADPKLPSDIFENFAGLVEYVVYGAKDFNEYTKYRKFLFDLTGIDSRCSIGGHDAVGNINQGYILLRCYSVPPRIQINPNTKLYHTSSKQGLTQLQPFFRSQHETELPFLPTPVLMTETIHPYPRVYFGIGSAVSRFAATGISPTFDGRVYEITDDLSNMECYKDTELGGNAAFVNTTKPINVRDVTEEYMANLKGRNQPQQTTPQQTQTKPQQTKPVQSSQPQPANTQPASNQTSQHKETFSSQPIREFVTHFRNT